MTTKAWIRCSAMTVAMTMLGLAACKRAGDAPRDRPSASAFVMRHIDVSRANYLSPYPMARWRLVDRRVLDRSVVWVSHILIRHDGVPNGVVSFAAPLWFPAPPLPARSRDEALALAQTVRDRAAAAPERFGELAGKYSEDIASQDRGGSLGGVTVYSLYRWPQVLDALAALPDGGVSEVVETEYGFHILSRRAPPPEETVSGVRLVIGYDEAPWLRTFLARGSVPARARAEALMLAHHLHEQARTEKGGLPALIERYSEHVDAVRGGDLGQWSTREPTLWPREVEVLQGLKIGEVAPPIDTLMGIALIQRTPNRPRQTLDMSAIQVPFMGDDSPAAAASKQAAFEQIQAAARAVRADPSRFEVLQAELGRYEPNAWQEGRDAAPVEARLLGLGIGAIDPEPVLVGSLSSYLLVKRLAPSPADATALSRPVHLGIPSPDVPDVRYWVSEELSASEVRGLLEEAGAAAELAPEQRQSLRQGIDSFADDISAEAAADAYDRFREQTIELLGAAKAAAYWATLDRRLETAILTPREAKAR